ncbi:MAG TPA: OmpH family outer membrane protein [Saprospiraceae bacterium]|nr:OmpH family outer membrane protein [Saprospiraceae bacterium]
MNKFFTLTLGLMLTVVTGVFSQKFGFCNSALLLTQMPEVKAADSDLQAFQTQLTKKGQERVKALQDAAAELERKKQQGTISPKDSDAQYAKLEEERQSIAKYEQEVYQKLTQKREELYKPLLDKVNKAMADVANENGFALVFDSSTQILVYAHESLDVTKMVKTKLGIAN